MTSQFIGNHLTWNVHRTDRTFRVHVVEPGVYDPVNHATIFNAALSTLIPAPSSELRPSDRSPEPLRAERFDLVTFPEAFLPADEFTAALRTLSKWPSVGCVHVGLRPSLDSNHLFTVTQLRQMLDWIRAIDNIALSDLANFDTWLQKQQSGQHFNIACLFAMDAAENLRVCLHPKLERSKFEYAALPENFLIEGSILSVVTLKPTDKRLMSISIQPLICSDTLLLHTDRPGSRPLEAVHLDANCLGTDPPDHIDVVSVVTCTPQDENSTEPRFRAWKTPFKDAFQRSHTDDAMSRHHFATFVLSNFGRDPSSAPAGLSGTFYPAQPPGGALPDVNISCWGVPEGDFDPRWSNPLEDHSKWKIRGHMVAINPFGAGASSVARMFGVTFSALPRHISPWSRQPVIGNCSIKIANYTGEMNLTFTEADYE